MTELEFRDGAQWIRRKPTFELMKTKFIFTILIAAIAMVMACSPNSRAKHEKIVYTSHLQAQHDIEVGILTPENASEVAANFKFIAQEEFEMMNSTASSGMLLPDYSCGNYHYNCETGESCRLCTYVAGGVMYGYYECQSCPYCPRC